MRDDTVVAGEATDAVGAPSSRADHPARSEWVESIYHRYAGELWAVLYSKTCNPELARDAVQEAFLRLQRQESETLRDVRAWLIQVGRNWIRDQHRQTKRTAPSGSDMESVIGDAQQPLDDLLNAEQRELVRAGLLELREDDRHVLVLRYALNWSSARMAAALDVRPAAIDMRLSRARKRLAEVLREQGMLFDETSGEASSS